MNIVIKIIEGDKIIDYESLSDKQKKEYGQIGRASCRERV